MSFTPNQIEAAGLLFEEENGNVLGDYEKGVVAESDLEGRELREVKNELIDSVTFPTELNAHDRCGIYWALSKTFDSDLIGWWTSQLRNEVENKTECVFQIMIALDNLEEPIFVEDRSGYSTLETEFNLRDARNYLDGKEINTPGGAQKGSGQCSMILLW